MWKSTAIGGAKVSGRPNRTLRALHRAVQFGVKFCRCGRRERTADARPKRTTAPKPFFNAAITSGTNEVPQFGGDFVPAEMSRGQNGPPCAPKKSKKRRSAGMTEGT